jgi:hypothetical protein
LGPSSFHHLSSHRQGARRPPRARRCLLKGCERWFTPSCPQSRYCSRGCQEAARRWRRAKASRDYRASAAGRQRRRAQHQRYRQRRRERAAEAASAAAAAGREGQRPACPGEDFVEFLCARPGCYVTFWVNPTRSCQRFCSLACRLALRRALDREARYLQRRRRWRRERQTRRRPRPDTS